MPRASLLILAATVTACSGGTPATLVAPAPITVPVAPIAAPAPVPVPTAPSVTPPSAEPREAALEPLAEATCIVHDTAVKEAGVVALSFHGKRFAFDEVRDEVELRATDKAATMTITSSEHVLTGEVRTSALTLYPRAPMLTDGWVAILHASPRSIAGDAATLSASFPPMVKPAKRVISTLLCRDLSLLAVPHEETAGKRVWIKPATKTSLRDAPRGATLAAIETEPQPTKKVRELSLGWGDDAREAFELARKDGAVRVRIVGPAAYVEGWIDASAIGKPPPQSGMMMSLLGSMGGLQGAKRTLTCARDVPVWVRDGETVKVGIVRANAPIRPIAESKDEVTVDIGAQNVLGALFGERVETLTPFVKRASLEGCAEKK